MIETNDSSAAPGLTRSQIRRSFSIWTWEGSAATVQITLTAGAFQTGFALYLGCTNVEIGLLAAIPSFLGLLQLVASYLLQHTQQRKAIVMWFSLIARLLWLPMLLIPFLLPHRTYVAVFLLLTLLGSILGNVASPLWMAWMSDLIPEHYRGRYFGRKNMYGGIVGMVVSVAGGLYLDSATHLHQPGQTRTAFAVLFIISLVFAVVSFFLGMQSPDVPPTQRPSEEAKIKPADFFAIPFRDRNFVRLMVFFVIFVLARAVAGNFFVVYQIKTLALNYTAIQSLGAVASLAGLAAMPVWGYLADKYGNKPVLMICAGMVVFPPFLWLLTTPDGIPGLWTFGAHHYLIFSYTKLDIIFLNLIAGTGWAGIGLTEFNLMLASAPSERRTLYVSAISAVAGVAGGVGPLLGGALLTALAPLHFPHTGLIRNNYAALFILSGILRFTGLLLLRPVREKGSREALYVLDQLKGTRPLETVANLRKLSRGDSAQSRQEAVQELARLKTPLAVEELVHALDDVALPVREQAAVALGEIGDSRATESLVRKLTDPASGITPAAATALGKIGDRAALPALAAAAQLGPPSRQLAALEALGHLADPRVTDVLLDLLADPAPGVRTAVIRALAEREETRSAPALLAALLKEHDPATLAVLADALGRVGDASMGAALAAALDRISSPTVQREILNAMGSLLGGRDAFYPYLALDSFGRDEAVTKILTNIQRRFRTRAAQRLPGAARVAASARRALRAYAEGNLPLCLRLLARLARLPSLSDRNEPGVACLEALVLRAERSQQTTATEEILLAVFLIRQMTDVP